MSEPAAVQRARSLQKHVKHLGADPAEFFVPVTREEAWELVRWYVDELEREHIGDERFDFRMFAHDVAVAKRRDNPFLVLEHFTLHGLAIRPKEGIH